jgi:hypothetical protein
MADPERKRGRDQTDHNLPERRKRGTAPIE